jgi:hypothetical protein
MLRVIGILLAFVACFVVFSSSPSSARTCKAGLDYCLQHFVRPGNTDDAAHCRANYAEGVKTGYWPAHPSTNSPGFPCTK